MRKLDKKGQGAMEYLMTYGWAIMVVMIVGVVLWQMGVFKLGQAGKGQTGFGQMKVIDHSYVSGGNKFDVVFMNGAGVTVNGTCVINRGGASSQSFGFIAPGDKFKVTLTSPSTECPSSGASYDFYINVTWTNSVTGIAHKETGRIWGTC